jgi:Zn-finger nucleic acid-binding protein
MKKMPRGVLFQHIRETASLILESNDQQYGRQLATFMEKEAIKLRLNFGGECLLLPQASRRRHVPKDSQDFRCPICSTYYVLTDEKIDELGEPICPECGAGWLDKPKIDDRTLLEQRVTELWQAKPTISGVEVKKAVGGRNSDIYKILRKLKGTE